MYSNYDSYTYQTSSLLDTINGLGKFINIISLIIGILSLIAMYKLYKKLGMPGWYALIPIYNIVKLFNYFELSGWLILVPGLNVGCMFYCYYKILEKFNKGKWYYICLIPFTFIVLLIVAFSKEENNTQNMQVNEEPNNDSVETNNVVMNTNLDMPIHNSDELTQKKEYISEFGIGEQTSNTQETAQEIIPPLEEKSENVPNTDVFNQVIETDSKDDII